MTSLTQDQRKIRVETVLGADALVLERFTGDEAVSTPGLFTLDLLSENAAIAAADLLRTPVCVTLALPDGSERFIHGRIRKLTQLGQTQRLTEYRAEVVPWLWFLSLSSDCRIFQQKSVPDIVSQVFKDLGFTDFALRLHGRYAPREYCVQYRETHLDFVSRLMEEEGIFYFFDHRADKHVMVLADAPTEVRPCPLQPRARLGRFNGPSQHEDVVTGLVLDSSAHTGKISLTDYNYLTPLSNLATSLPDNSEEEAYDYPGRYGERGGGERYARIRLEEQEATHQVAHGEGTVRDFRPGHKFTLADHYRGDANIAYQILSVHHQGGGGGFRSGAGDDTLDYRNSFTCIPASVHYRPPRRTRRAVVRGSQTAVVVGKAGEEIWTDSHGRVKVHFHWDRVGHKDESSSCWVRVSTAWAGKAWGAVHLPRIGQEVIVDFLEGDPDQPIITGRVYNADQVVPWTLPANQTQSGVKSRSSKGGTGENFNELRFEDKKGSEEIYFHAEKNKRVIVENDNSESVGHDETITIGNDRTESVEKNETISIGENRTKTVGKNDSLSVEIDQTISVGKKQSLSVGTDQSIDVGANRTDSVGKNETITIGADRKTDVGKNDSLQVGKKLTIEAGDQITLQTGDASITMKKDGTITIKGKDIKIDGSGKITVKASSDVVIKGSKVTAN